MKLLSLISILTTSILCLSSCNYITIVNTHGTAEDVVDEAHTPQTTVSPTVSIPKSVI